MVDPRTIERVSVASDGTQADGSSSLPSISADGRFVVFFSGATNLVPGDTNNRIDVFVVDRETGTIERVSVAGDGTQGNDQSVNPSVSADGRFIAFDSLAGNLVPDDTNGQRDVFVVDRDTGVIKRVSLAANSAQGDDLSASPSISADGRFVAFESDATNLVPGDTNGKGDIFVVNRETGAIERVSVAVGGAQGDNASFSPSISTDGRFVTFESGAANLVPGDTNGKNDIFVVDRETGAIERVSVASDGTQADNFSTFPSVSANGRFVSFFSAATNLVPGDTNGDFDLFVFDRETDTIGRVLASDGAQADQSLPGRTISADGRFVAFRSTATNLVPGDTNGVGDIFVAGLPTLTILDATIAEGNAGGTNLVFTIALSPAAPDAVTVTATTANGTALAGSDYAAKTQVVTIPGGQTSATFTVQLAGDTVIEPNETFTVTLSDPANAVIGAPAAAMGTIVNDDATLAIAGASVTEGNGGTSDLMFTITRVGATAQAATVTATTSNGTASAGSDYTTASGTVTIPAGQASATFTVAVLGDTLVEADETLTVTLSNPVGATLGAQSAATGTIINDDAQPVLSIATASLVESNAGANNLVFTVSLSAPSAQAVSATATTQDEIARAGTDYTATSSLVTIPAGQTSATFSVPVNGDIAIEIDESLAVVLSNPTGGATISATAGAARGFILNDDVTPSIAINGQTIAGTAGDDFLVAGALNDSVRGEGGGDTEFGNEQNDVLIGGAGSDFILGDFPGNFLDGSADFIDAGDGNDNVFGGGGNDTILGGPGDDLIGGDFGDNLIFGGDGNNALIGFGGADTIEGGNDGDIVFGLSGPDVISTKGGFDLIIAGGDLDGPTDADFIDVADGGSQVFAGSGDDTIIAGEGPDFMLGESGADIMRAGGGADIVIAGPGNDTLDGGAGNDVIIPEGGDDLISGGAGADLFRYPGTIAVNADRITDFVPADDTIELGAALGFANSTAARAAVAQVGADAVLTLPAGAGSITFVGVQASALTAADFVIA